MKKTWTAYIPQESNVCQLRYAIPNYVKKVYASLPLIDPAIHKNVTYICWHLFDIRHNQKVSEITCTKTNCPFTKDKI